MFPISKDVSDGDRSYFGIVFFSFSISQVRVCQNIVASKVGVVYYGMHSNISVVFRASMTFALVVEIIRINNFRFSRNAICFYDWVINKDMCVDRMYVYRKRDVVRRHAPGRTEINPQRLSRVLSMKLLVLYSKFCAHTTGSSKPYLLQLMSTAISPHTPP